MPKPTLTALDRFRDALTAHNCNPRGTAARCPAHDDRSPSAWAVETAQGVRIGCFAECPADLIVEALT